MNKSKIKTFTVLLMVSLGFFEVFTLFEAFSLKFQENNSIFSGT